MVPDLGAKRSLWSSLPLLGSLIGWNVFVIVQNTINIGAAALMEGSNDAT